MERESTLGGLRGRGGSEVIGLRGRRGAGKKEGGGRKGGVGACRLGKGRGRESGEIEKKGNAIYVCVEIRYYSY